MKNNAAALCRKCPPSRVVFWLIVLQPVLDAASFWTTKLNITPVTTSLRMAMLVLVAVWGFGISGRKKGYLAVLGLLAAYGIVHLFVCLRAGYGNLMADLANLLRYAHMPVMTMAFLAAFSRDDRTAEAVQKGFLGNLVLVLLFLLLSRTVGPRNYTYDVHDIGVIGWTAVENCQSILITILAPPILLFTYRRGKRAAFATAAAVCFAQMFLVGTRVAFYSVFLIAGGFCVIFLLCREKKLFWYSTLAACMVLAAALYPLSPNQAYAKSHEAHKADYQPLIDEAFEGVEVCRSGEDMDEKQRAAYLTVYGEYLPGLVERFGLERTVERYQGTVELETLRNTRLRKLVFCEFAREDGDAADRLFGLGLGRLTCNQGVYDPENDFYGLLYTSGYVGTALYLGVLALFAARTLLALFFRFRKVFTVELGTVCMTICLLVGAGICSGYVFRRPNVSIFLSLMLAWLWSLLPSGTKKDIK